MAEIHNSKQRMPFILSRNIEQDWLGGKEVEYQEIALTAKALGQKQNTLF